MYNVRSYDFWNQIGSYRMANGEHTDIPIPCIRSYPSNKIQSSLKITELQGVLILIAKFFTTIFLWIFSYFLLRVRDEYRFLNEQCSRQQCGMYNS